MINWKGCGKKRSWSNILSQHFHGKTEDNHFNVANVFTLDTIHRHVSKIITTELFVFRCDGGYTYSVGADRLRCYLSLDHNSVYRSNRTSVTPHFSADNEGKTIHTMLCFDNINQVTMDKSKARTL